MTGAGRDRERPSGGPVNGLSSNLVALDLRQGRIKLRHLRYFVAAAEYGSFRKAGCALGVEQSAISRRVRDLEDQLGAALFHRRASGVHLTIAGQKYLPRARNALHHIHAGAHDVAAVGRTEQGRIKVGVFSSVASGFLFDLLHAFGTRYENVRVDLIEGNPSEHVAAVRQIQLDIGFITGTSPRDGCEVELLWHEKVFVVLPLQHPLAARAELEWIDLASERFIVSDAPPGQEIHDYLVGHLGGLGRHPEIHCQYVGRDNILSLVAVGRGLTLTSQATTAAKLPGIVYRPIAGEILPFSAVWSIQNDNPACRRMLSLARSMAGHSTGMFRRVD